MMTSLGRLLTRHAQIVVLILLFAAASLGQSDFLSRLNLSAIAVQYAIIGLIALGQFATMLTGGIDLSQGSIIALSSVTVAAASQSFGLAGGIVAALLVSAAVGAVNGALATFTRIPPFVITLGMLGAVRGLALTATNSRPIPITDPGYMAFGRSKFLEVPSTFWLFLLMAVALSLLLRHWPLGRHFYAVGGNEENSRLSGVNVPSVKLTAYVISGLLSGLAGLAITSRMGTGHPLSGTNYELESIAAVIIGGASLFGGIGRVSNVVAGVLILGIVNSVINLLGISPYLHGTLKGTVVLLAVALSQVDLRQFVGRGASASQGLRRA